MVTFGLGPVALFFLRLGRGIDDQLQQFLRRNALGPHVGDPFVPYRLRADLAELGQFGRRVGDEGELALEQRNVLFVRLVVGREQLGR